MRLFSTCRVRSNAIAFSALTEAVPETNLSRPFATIFLALAVASFSVISAFADTNVSGAITGNTLWKKADSPFVVTADVSVQSGATLTIEAGTTVRFSLATSLRVISGALVAVGTATDNVSFTSVRDVSGSSPAAAAGDWNGLQFAAATNSATTRLAYAQVKFGKGIQLRGASPIISNTTLLNNASAAIDIDLSSSPTGSGLVATGNQLNAISVPAGDVTGSVTWGLVGIPYVVTSGIVSIGASPTINTVSPRVVQSGQSITATVTGQRLSGASNPRLSNAAVTATLVSGATDTQLQLLIAADVAAAAGEIDLTLLTDAGDVVKTAAIGIIRAQPQIATVVPASVYTGRGDIALALTGINFVSGSVAQVDDVTVATVVQSATQITATLPNQTTPGNRSIRLKTPDPLTAGAFILSDPVQVAVSNPSATLAPTPLSLLNGATREITITLPFAAPTGGLDFNITSSAPLVASAPSAVTVPVGASTVVFVVQATGVGQSNLTIGRAGWNAMTLPVTVIEAPQSGTFTPITSTLVGVQVGLADGGASSTSRLDPVVSPGVGIVVGAAITSVLPKAAVVGTSVIVVVNGTGLGSVTAVSMVPSSGVVIGTISKNGDGTQLSFTVAVDAGAAIGTRQLVVRSADVPVVFARQEDGVFLIAAPIPLIDSITPAIVVAGQPATTLILRGANLSNVIGVRVEPSAGVSVIGQVTSNAAATQLEFSLQAAAGTPSGARVIIVQTASGESTALAMAGNTVQVVQQLGDTFSPIVSPVVGVTVGVATATTTLALNALASPIVGLQVGTEATVTQTPLGPWTAAPVGIVVGAAASGINPNVGGVGTQVTVTVTGVGLNGVTAVDFLPPGGLVVAPPTVASDGKQVQVQVTINAAADKTMRAVILRAGGAEITFVDAAANQFLIAAPPPLIDSVSPQQVLTGSTSQVITVRGSNLRDILAASLLPGDGVTVLGSPSVTSDGTQLTFTIQVAANATPGQRTVVITSAGGQSSTTASSGNTLQIVNQLGLTLDPLVSPVVGVTVGSANEVPTLSGSLTDRVGLVVGAAVTSISPVGGTLGSSGQLRIVGIGLSATTSVSLTNLSVVANGVSVGALAINAQGTEIIVPYTVAANAPVAQYRVDVASTSGLTLYSDPTRSQFAVNAVPLIASASPNVLQRGRAYTLMIRGQNLAAVTSVALEDAGVPTVGIALDVGAPVFGTDGLGEFVTVRLLLDSTTPLGAKVIRLYLPGAPAAASTDQATTANTVTVTAQ